MNKNKAVVIFSGGLDSTTLLHHVAQDHEVYGISFDYRQRHHKELDFARYWAEKLCKDWRVIDIGFLSEIGQSALTSDVEMPHEHYTHESQKVTVVPNRNMIMLSIAISLAEGLEIDKVFYGCHSNDRAIYPDCRVEFVDSINQTSQLATYTQVQVLAPFVNKLKADIVSIGARLDIDFAMTWSCYEGKEKHCGQCATCQERIEAFQIAGVDDPTLYF